MEPTCTLILFDFLATQFTIATRVGNGTKNLGGQV